MDYQSGVQHARVPAHQSYQIRQYLEFSKLHRKLDRIDDLVENYQHLTKSMPKSGLLRDARIVHTGMAAGGDGNEIASDEDRPQANSHKDFSV